VKHIVTFKDAEQVTAYVAANPEDPDEKLVCVQSNGAAFISPTEARRFADALYNLSDDASEGGRSRRVRRNPRGCGCDE
jgi:alkanesulfonate monooxygenase SsuD/methylene tetrahydromethanopterin reductase-like flavin-dependent oxidoreductase (luciferase family)